MSWFPVDDEFYLHPKAIKAGNAAIGLWTRAGSWSMKHTTEGAVSADLVAVLGGTKRDVNRLVSSGLWTKTEEGYQFNDWADWGQKKTREQVKHERKSATERKARQRAREREARETEAQVSDPCHAVTPAGQTAESHRESQRTLDTNTNTSTKKTKTSSKSLRDPDGFEEFWQAYPRREAKQGAKDKFARLLRNGLAPATLIEGARRYAAYCTKVEREREKIKLPTTWLNQGCWDDDLGPVLAPAADPAADPDEWLKDQWRQGIVSDIEQRTGLHYPSQSPPPDVDEIGKWVLTQRRDWITDNRLEILARLKDRVCTTPSMT